MPNYKIKASYETGDSFGHHDVERCLEMTWTNLDKAKAALKRIKEHYVWYADKHGWCSEDVPEPEWHKATKYDCFLKLELDNGQEVQISAPWCGYFERLHMASIIIDGDTDMEIKF